MVRGKQQPVAHGNRSSLCEPSPTSAGADDYVMITASGRYFSLPLTFYGSSFIRSTTYTLGASYLPKKMHNKMLTLAAHYMTLARIFDAVSQLGSKHIMDTNA